MSEVNNKAALDEQASSHSEPAPEANEPMVVDSGKQKPKSAETTSIQEAGDREEDDGNEEQNKQSHSSTSSLSSSSEQPEGAPVGGQQDEMMNDGANESSSSQRSQSSSSQEEEQEDESKEEGEEEESKSIILPATMGTVTRSGGVKPAASQFASQRKQNGAKKQAKDLSVEDQTINHASDATMVAMASAPVTTQAISQPRYARPIASHYAPAKQRFLYKPFIPLPNLQEYISELIEVRVYAEYLTKFNKAFMKRNFYGQDIYTSDSDVVCILQHVGFLKITDEQPDDFEAISVYFRVMKGRNNYPSQARNGIRSRRMAQFDGHSIKYESAEYLCNLGSHQELKQMTALMPTRVEQNDHHSQRKQQMKTRIACMKMPDPGYKAINPALIFNLSLEPALVFNLSTFADKGGDDQIVGNRISFKLLDCALYIETDSARYEICKWPPMEQVAQTQGGSPAKFRLAIVQQPFFKDNSYMYNTAKQIPLPDSELQVLGTDLDWSDFMWGEQSLIVKGIDNLKLAPLKNYKYFTLRV